MSRSKSVAGGEVRVLRRRLEQACRRAAQADPDTDTGDLEVDLLLAAYALGRALLAADARRQR